ncbi:hypothetical protein MERGE_002897 [Pneumocystis wakefieldiae]|uniref:Rgp1-domain-containing protein n=1 Tax=Pneumocystis wakefieldiae TaxID=38082 RepID=A0A899FZ83_9ASCO|nr:hypothetical protein MERGE_002897 [Pneumocystis wakefieldiae]
MCKIRVDVRRKEGPVFAGGFLSCTVTFGREMVEKKEASENQKNRKSAARDGILRKKTQDMERGLPDLPLPEKSGEKTAIFGGNRPIFDRQKSDALCPQMAAKNTAKSVDQAEGEVPPLPDKLDIGFGQQKSEKIPENEEKNEKRPEKGPESEEIEPDGLENDRKTACGDPGSVFLGKNVELGEKQGNTDVFYGFSMKSHHLDGLEMSSEVGIGSAGTQERLEDGLKEKLLIGYIQIIGYIVLNEKIINTEKFEGVNTNKYSRKSAKSELIRIDPKMDHKLRFVNHIGKFKKTKKLKHIPILSTPPSILFIDLELAPGESRSYSFSFKLPSQLPPSYEGSRKSIQPLKISDIPFEVLYKIDESGNQIIYDLFSPIIYLTDEAQVFSCDLSENDHNISNTEENSNDLDFRYEDDKYSKRDFIYYLSEHLLDESLKKLLLSNSTEENTQECFSDAQEEINLLINMENIIQDITENNSSHNNFSNKKFNINKNGNIIGIISVLKLSYKLGETITGVIDFSSSKIPCYHVKFFLETTEIIDESITHCSKANISQTTRKIYDSYSETTICATRIQFKLLIPTKAPFSFKTSGVSLLWTIRLEITIPLTTSEQVSHADYPLTKTLALPKLLKENYRDYRETHYFASSSLECETFYCTIPIMVFPSLKSDLSSNLLNTTFYI